MIQMKFLEKPLQHVRAWNHLALGLILPSTCARCDQSLTTENPHPELCPDCRKTFVPTNAYCRGCGLPVKSELGCFACRDQAFAFDRVFTLGSYESGLAEAVVRMKNDSGQALAFAVGRELGKHVAAQLSDCNDRDSQIDIVTCVPKHWTKRFFSGVNGPEVLMEGLSQAANLNSAADLLRCNRRIRKQSLLSPDQRRQNVKRAWLVSSDYLLKDARVLVVDDIMTTGSTAHEIAKALKKAGADNVSVAVVGRARRN